ncbi:MAG: response regulator, partial [Bacteroidales bacterium]|nr:response regulator [Bacteroidales bacterium]
DDEPINLVLLEELLINSMPVKIFKAQNGKEAIDICKHENGLTIVLMDLKMPIMDGYEATRRIKKMFPAIKIIAQSAYNSNHEINAAIAAGCDEFISKPIDPNKLLQVISKYMSN